MLDTIKRHLISAGVTFLSTLALAILASLMNLDKGAAWSTYLAAGSIFAFVMVVARGAVKIIFEALVPAIQSAIPSLMELFQSFIDWAKNLTSKNN